MRKEMRLSRECIANIRYFKNQLEKEEGIKATYGFIVNRIIRELYPIYREIDWKKVKKTRFFVSETSVEICSVVTALNLEKTVIDYIEEMRGYFNEVFQVNRVVYMPFVIRLAVRASLLRSIHKNISINSSCDELAATKDCLLKGLATGDEKDPLEPDDYDVDEVEAMLFPNWSPEEIEEYYSDLDLDD